MASEQVIQRLAGIHTPSVRRQNVCTHHPSFLQCFVREQEKLAKKSKASAVVAGCAVVLWGPASACLNGAESSTRHSLLLPLLSRRSQMQAPSWTSQAGQSTRSAPSGLAAPCQKCCVEASAVALLSRSLAAIMATFPHAGQLPRCNTSAQGRRRRLQVLPALAADLAH